MEYWNELGQDFCAYIALYGSGWCFGTKQCIKYSSMTLVMADHVGMTFISHNP